MLERIRFCETHSSFEIAAVFPSRVGKRKRAPISKQTCSSQRLRSYIFLALRAKIKTFLANGSTQIRESTKRYREKMCPDYCIPSPIPFLIFSIVT